MRTLRPVVATAALAVAVAAPTALVATAQVATASAGSTAGSTVGSTVVIPRIKASVSPRWVEPGAGSVITGTLLVKGDPLSDQRIKLFARTPGTGAGFNPIDSAVTSPEGTVSFSVTPASRTVYRLKFGGTESVHSMVSRHLAVGVKGSTKLGVAVLSGARGALVKGQLTGHKHRLKAKPVALVKWTDEGWTKVGVDLTNGRGRVSFKLAGADAEGEFRLRFPGTKRYLPSTSPTVTIG